MSTKETPTTTATGTAKAKPAAPATGLRERKKQKTRRAIQQEAFRLFAEQGYQATTVEQIAAAAEVSPSTVFRYFATKEDLVVSDDYNASLADALAGRPADEPVIDAIRHVMSDSVAGHLGSPDEALVLRTRLSFSDPDLRARAFEDQLQSQQEIADLIADRTGRSADDLEVSCAAAAVIAVSMTVLRHWVDGDGQADLGELYDRQLRLLSEGLPF